MKNKDILRVFVFALLAVYIFFLSSIIFAQQPAPPPKAKPAAVKEKTEKIVASPANIKQGTAIYVFVAWMWVAIFILIYILRLNIKESDRLFLMKYFSSDKK